MEAWDICIDVSHWQGDEIDWAAVAASGIRIAMVKASEGSREVDRSFHLNRPRAEAAGIVVIPYHFMRPGAPKDQVRQFRDIADLGPGMLAALDWEGRASQSATPADAEAIGDGVAAIIGRLPLGYWGIPGSTPAAPTEAMRAWPRWVPRYPVVGVNSYRALPQHVRVTPQGYWKGRYEGQVPEFGQYTAWGRVPGVPGLCDRSVAFFASADAAVSWCRGNPPEGADGSV